MVIRVAIGEVIAGGAARGCGTTAIATADEACMVVGIGKDQKPKSTTVLELRTTPPTSRRKRSPFCVSAQQMVRKVVLTPTAGQTVAVNASAEGLLQTGRRII